MTSTIIANWRVRLTSPDGRTVHVLTAYLRHEAEAILATYLGYGWSGQIERG